MNRIVIIGASDAGISAALSAREYNRSTEIHVLSADNFPNFSICGIPFFISGEVPEWQNLAHRRIGELEAFDIDFLPGHNVREIDAGSRQILASDPAGTTKQIDYDRLIIGTGAVPVSQKIPGYGLPGVFLLRFMEEALELQKFITERSPSSALIIGGGYIGMEMAEALHRRGISVSLAEIGPTVMPTLDPDMGEILREALASRGVQILTQTPVAGIEQAKDTLLASGQNGPIGSFDMILMATGVRPETSLAERIGIHTGTAGAIRVNRRMETNVSDIYAAGDCVETWYRLLDRYDYMPLGSTAHKQGRIAGINAAGGDMEFKGIVGTQVVKIFDQVAARTGLKESEAESAGMTPFSVRLTLPDHKRYYPGAQDMHIRIIGDLKTGRLLGAQILGRIGSEISKRIDIFATALHCGLTVADIAELDLSYTPPLSSPWDPVQEAAKVWLRHEKAPTGVFPITGKT